MTAPAHTRHYPTHTQGASTIRRTPPTGTAPRLISACMKLGVSRKGKARVGVTQRKTEGFEKRPKTEAQEGAFKTGPRHPTGTATRFPRACAANRSAVLKATPPSEPRTEAERVRKGPKSEGNPKAWRGTEHLHRSRFQGTTGHNTRIFAK